MERVKNSIQKYICTIDDAIIEETFLKELVIYDIENILSKHDTGIAVSKPLLQRFVEDMYTGLKYNNTIYQAFTTIPFPDSFFENIQIDYTLLKLIIFSYVIDAINTHMIVNPTFAMDCMNIWIEADIPPDAGLFGVVKKDSIFQPLINIYTERINSKKGVLVIPINVAEAIVQDVADGYITNATTGVYVNKIGPTESTKGLNEIFNMNTSEEYCILYILWNLSFVCRYGDLSYFLKLILPSMLNTIKSPKTFMINRLNTLATLLARAMMSQNEAFHYYSLDLAFLRKHFQRRAHMYRKSIEKKTSGKGCFVRIIKKILGAGILQVLGLVTYAEKIISLFG